MLNQAVFCPKCGRQNESVAKFCQGCGNVLALPERSVRTESSRTLSYGGFWKRFAATIIDSIIVSTATGILTAITFGGGWPAIFFLPWVYEAWMTSSEKQATLGKMALGMIVTDLQGGRISFARATGRHFAKYISVLIMFIGFIIAAFTERKQALHDMIADTLVVNN